MKAYVRRGLAAFQDKKIYQFINHLNFLIMGLIKKPNELQVKENLVSTYLRTARYGKDHAGLVGTASASSGL